ncbi:MAG: indolepyruvate ferredoxin oxidoreductase subunit alpha [Gracilibacteraceae bacterium]|nr:indolepyruvate ferredoxin oxidoreductase subunit alpha [Gracilibacteraceae bacterium]
MKVLMTGNEAIARGAWEAGVVVCTAYPGTPSTEIIENAATYKEIDSEWSPNEKVALEVGLGAAVAGGRTLVAMKHVGVNVAADPLFTLSYTGVNAGLVLISADDPGMHSSQDEQDNRHYGRAAKIPVLEPSDSQECLDYVKLALTLSEEYDTPVMLRMTTRVSHSQSLVSPGNRQEVSLRDYSKNPSKYIMLPGHARLRHPIVEERLKKLAAYAETSPLNRTEEPERSEDQERLEGTRRVGVITNGITYQYAREVLDENVSLLKLGMTYPLPRQLISDFIQSVDECYIIEELDSFIEDQIRAWGFSVYGKEVFPTVGELLPETIASCVPSLLKPSLRRDFTAASRGTDSESANTGDRAPVQHVGRPPVLCPGCPHRAVFYVLNRLKLTVSGDIGCYTLGALPPLNAMDTTICMGASIGVALGMEKARGRDFARNLVAVIGDSTFVHSGITALIDVVYNKGTTTTLILDNSTTGMTGHQENPATGVTVRGEVTTRIDLPMLVRAVGVNRVVEVDPFDLDRFTDVLKREMAAEEPSVIIVKRPCVLVRPAPARSQVSAQPPVSVNSALCTGCAQCLRLGCPCLVKDEPEPGAKIRKVSVDASQCIGCGLCVSLCRPQAIVRKEG